MLGFSQQSCHQGPFRVLTTSNRKPPLRSSDSRWTIQRLTRSTLGAPGSNLSTARIRMLLFALRFASLIYFVSAGAAAVTPKPTIIGSAG